MRACSAPRWSSTASRRRRLAFVRRQALRPDLATRAAQPRRGAVRTAEDGRRALRRHVRQYRRRDPAQGARRLHGGPTRPPRASRSRSSTRAPRTIAEGARRAISGLSGNVEIPGDGLVDLVERVGPRQERRTRHGRGSGPSNAGPRRRRPAAAAASRGKSGKLGAIHPVPEVDIGEEDVHLGTGQQVSQGVPGIGRHVHVKAFAQVSASATSSPSSGSSSTSRTFGSRFMALGLLFYQWANAEIVSKLAEKLKIIWFPIG